MNLFLLCKIQERGTKFWDLLELGGQTILFDGVTKEKARGLSQNISQKSIGTYKQPTERLSTSSKLKRDKLSTSYIKKELKYIKFLPSSTFAINLRDSPCPDRQVNCPTYYFLPYSMFVTSLSILIKIIATFTPKPTFFLRIKTRRPKNRIGQDHLFLASCRCSRTANNFPYLLTT